MLIPDIRNEYRHGNRMLTSVFLALAAAPLAANLAGTSKKGAVGLVFPACTVLQHTGRLCSGCGLTRSVLAFYKGDFALSHAWHPAGSLLVALIALQLVFRVLYLADRSAWLPWIDIGQILLTGLLFRCVLIANGPVSGDRFIPSTIATSSARTLCYSKGPQFKPTTSAVNRSQYVEDSKSTLLRRNPGSHRAPKIVVALDAIETGHTEFRAIDFSERKTEWQTLL